MQDQMHMTWHGQDRLQIFALQWLMQRPSCSSQMVCPQVEARQLRQMLNDHGKGYDDLRCET